MLNKKESYKYLLKLKQDFDDWEKSDSFMNTRWSDDILQLPNILKECLDLYFDESKSVGNNEKLCIEKTFCYVQSEIDFLPEEFMGMDGYIDDLYVNKVVYMCTILTLIVRI